MMKYGKENLKINMHECFFRLEFSGRLVGAFQFNTI